ncbi:invasion associated locus B family protein [Brucella pseudogrignonensis]|jgi:invasion protein IalB
MKNKLFIAGFGLLLPLATAGVAAPLPNGASTLTETYQDWTVSCQSVKDQTNCVMSQLQSSPETRQRVLTVELRNVAGKAEGVVVMPFGLDLSKGATAKIAGAALAPLRFSTCLPQGCLAPVTWDSKMFKSADNLDLTATALSPSQPVAFKISLKGFSPAFERIVALSK